MSVRRVATELLGALLVAGALAGCGSSSGGAVSAPVIAPAKVFTLGGFSRGELVGRARNLRPKKRRLTSATEFCNGADCQLHGCDKPCILQLILATCET